MMDDGNSDGIEEPCSEWAPDQTFMIIVLNPRGPTLAITIAVCGGM